MKKTPPRLLFPRLRGILSDTFFGKPERWLSGRRRRSRKPLTGFSRSGVRIPLSPPLLYSDSGYLPHFFPVFAFIAQKIQPQFEAQLQGEIFKFDHSCGAFDSTITAPYPTSCQAASSDRRKTAPTAYHTFFDFFKQFIFSFAKGIATPFFVISNATRPPDPCDYLFRRHFS